MRIAKKNQRNILELKNTMSEGEGAAIGGVNNRTGPAEDGIASQRKGTLKYSSPRTRGKK